MRVKKYLKVVKPSVKGSIMVLFGIFNSRLGIGIEIFTNNLIYGPLAYLFITLSGLLVIKLLQILDNPSNESRISKKQAFLLFITFYIFGFILIIANVVSNMAIYRLNIPIIFIVGFVGVLWCFFGFLGFKYRKYIILVNILIVSLAFSIGLVFGAFLNIFIIPIYLYLFFLSTFFLQSSRELMKGFDRDDKAKGFMRWEIRYNLQNVLRYSLLSELLTIVFLILLIVFNISNSILFLFLIICGIIIIGFTVIFTFESILEKKISYRIHSILKFGILIELIALLILSS